MQAAANVDFMKNKYSEYYQEFEEEDGEEMVIMKRARRARREQMVWVKGKTGSVESEVSGGQAPTQTQKRTFAPVHRRKKSSVKMSLPTIEEEEFASDEDGESTTTPKSTTKDIPDDVEKWEICTATIMSISIIVAAMIDIPKPRRGKDR